MHLLANMKHITLPRLLRLIKLRVRPEHICMHLLLFSLRLVILFSSILQVLNFQVLVWSHISFASQVKVVL